MTAVVAVMEWGVIVSLLLARVSMRRQGGGGAAGIGELVKDTLRGRGILLLTGGMAIGYLATDQASADGARAEVARLATVENAAWDRWIRAVTAASGAGP